MSFQAYVKMVAVSESLKPYCLVGELWFFCQFVGLDENPHKMSPVFSSFGHGQHFGVDFSRGWRPRSVPVGGLWIVGPVRMMRKGRQPLGF